MDFSSVLNITIPAVVIAYAIYLIYRILRKRKRCGHFGGCAGCPYANGCASVKEENDKHEP